ncbi:transposable element Tc1 transposase [Trichonephila clavipes]|nr:transposable element Tc1 transposase [Trichonephila clavipes]
MSPDNIFMNGNAREHKGLIVDELPKEDCRMECPSMSPVLNPIEHVWNGLGRVISQSSSPYKTPQELQVAILKEWTLLPLKFIDTLINSMASRCEA